MAFPPKVKLKPGEKYCQRCFGNRLFYTSVHNGSPVPAKPEKGICYRCRGTGKEPQRSKFTSQQRKDMREVFALVFANDVLPAPVVLTPAAVAMKLGWRHAHVQTVLRHLKACNFVAIAWRGTLQSIEATKLGMERFTQNVLRIGEG